MLEGIRMELLDLQRENELLRMIVRDRIKPMEVAERILSEAEAPAVDIYLHSSVLMDEAEKCRGELKEGSEDFEEENEERQKSGEQEPPIPKVLTLPAKKVECTKGRRKEESVEHHFCEVESLAAALSGDFAF